jgi:dsRNA-specific ribonuclease
LDATAALQHLHSFCAQLSRHSFADSEPQFSYQTTDLGLIMATVTLPYSVPLAARYASSHKSWRTEKAARRDAAFHAYAALWKAGLLNEHLLPIAEEWNPSEGLHRASPPARSMIEQPSFWVAPDGEDDWHSMMIHLQPVSMGKSLSSCCQSNMTVALHVCRWLAHPPPLELRWRSIAIRVNYEPAVSEKKPTSQDLGIMSYFTRMVHRAPRSPNHWQGGTDSLLALFQPPSPNSHPLDDVEQPVSDIYGQVIEEGIVRVTARGSKPYQFRKWAPNRQVVFTSLPKHRGFPSPAKQREVSSEGGNGNSPKTIREREEIFPIEDCTVSVISMDMVRLGLYMPTILQQLHDFTLVDRFMIERLSEIKPLHRDQVRAAITAPSANRPVNYQRLEFIGDSALKFLVTRYLYMAHPDWPEGYLSRRRSFLVCNATLAGAALEAELGKYVICDPVSYKDWKIPSTSSQGIKREVSTKLLADVLEAVIGVSWICGGIELTLKCTKVFIPQLLQPSMPPPMQALPMDKMHNGGEVEQLIGHTFRDASLLAQALTHPSIAQVKRTVSYERLEFLGDAVLDLLLTEIFAIQLETLTQGEMTQIRSAVVNGDLLGFMCFNLVYRTTNRAIVTEVANDHPREIRECRERSLADHLCFHPELAEIHHDNRERFKAAQHSIADQLENGETHPWDQLKMLKMNKMFSDMVESIFGAVFLDSGEDMDACRKFFERLGLLRYAWRLVNREITPAYEGVRIEARGDQE